MESISAGFMKRAALTSILLTLAGGACATGGQTGSGADGIPAVGQGGAGVAQDWARGDPTPGVHLPCAPARLIARTDRSADPDNAEFSDEEYS